MSGKYLFILLAVLLAGLNIAPLAVFAPGPDIQLHYVLIQCFAEAFWRGDFYARWCESANAGLGAPLFLFYLPLAYFFTAFIYPLTHFGLSMLGVVMLGFFIANLATFYTAWVWLKHSISPRNAFIGAAFYLFMPYRIELIYFRTGYAELWCMMWAPLLFLYAQRLVERRRGATVTLALIMAATLLTHLPQGIILLMFGGLYVALLDRKSLPAYGAAGVFVVFLTAFYWVPALSYHSYINTDSIGRLQEIWVDRAVRLADFSNPIRMAKLTNTFFLMAIFAFFSFELWQQRKKIPQGSTRAFVIITVIALAFTFNILPPFWHFSETLRPLISPWRMQSILSISATYIIAQKLHWRITTNKDGSSTMEMSIIAALLLALWLIHEGSWAKEEQAHMQKMAAARYVFPNEYYSRWTNQEVRSADYITSRLAEKPPFVTGNGKISWSRQNGTIEIDAAVPEKTTLRIDHFYFPLWRARDENAHDIPLEPEQGSGRILLTVPAGEHHIAITGNILNDRFYVMLASQLCSFFTLFLALLLQRKKILH